MADPIPFPGTSVGYVQVLDWETLKVVTRRFRSLHPDLLPIVVYRVLQDSWVGELTGDQVKQALRDCFDMCDRASKSPQGLYSPMGFLRQRLLLCLENQALGLDDDPTSASHPIPPVIPSRVAWSVDAPVSIALLPVPARCP